MKFNWENIYSEERDSGRVQFNTARAKVSGGWIVNHMTSVNNKPTQSMVFIEDKDHLWSIEK